MRPVLTDAEAYLPSMVGAVERLFEILSEIHGDPFLEACLVLHGGTALNLFHGPIPRLSVDIDLLYTGSADREEMIRERPEIEESIRRIARALRYDVSQVKAPRGSHAGSTYRLPYRDREAGSGVLKVDVNFLDRVPLWGWVERSRNPVKPPVVFRCVQPGELVARKVKALVERKRPAVRDVFDVDWFGSMRGMDRAEFRATVTYFFSLSDPFPTRIRHLDAAVLNRFKDIDAAIRTDLVPVLRHDEPFDAARMVRNVGSLLDEWGRLDPQHEEYLRRLDEENTFNPELLFAAWPEALDRARRSPMMARKLDNLRGRASRSG